MGKSMIENEREKEKESKVIVDKWRDSASLLRLLSFGAVVVVTHIKILL